MKLFLGPGDYLLIPYAENHIIKKIKVKKNWWYTIPPYITTGKPKVVRKATPEEVRMGSMLALMQCDLVHIP